MFAVQISNWRDGGTSGDSSTPPRAFVVSHLSAPVVTSGPLTTENWKHYHHWLAAISAPLVTIDVDHYFVSRP